MRDMGPLTIITGILLGTSFSIAFSLAAVLIIFWFLGDAYPRLDHEYPALLASFALFSVMTVISAASFYAMLKTQPARWALQAVMWCCLVAVGGYYWP